MCRLDRHGHRCDGPSAELTCGDSGLLGAPLHAAQVEQRKYHYRGGPRRQAKGRPPPSESDARLRHPVT
jgi:hypothetical protein